MISATGRCRLRLERKGEVKKGSGAGDEPLLVVITTNEERELPPAFLRRCIVHKLQHPGGRAVGSHRPPALQSPTGASFHRRAQRSGNGDRPAAGEVARSARERRQRLPGTAEYLDAVRVAISLNIEAGRGRPGMRS